MGVARSCTTGNMMATVSHWSLIEHKCLTDLGIDPYGNTEMENSRLPKILDDWLTAQIESGKEPEAIRKLVEITEEERTDVCGLPMQPEEGG
jgi:hypothetical protein